jgi:hypothetical protein
MFHAPFQRPDIDVRHGRGDLLNGDDTVRAKDEGDGGSDGGDDFGRGWNRGGNGRDG